MSRSTSDAPRRRELLDAAARLLIEEGEAALTIRRLAGEVGTSTMAVYTWFGGKPELLRALYREAFGRFGARLRRVRRSDDPVADLTALLQAYRRYGLSEPALYEIMFGRTSASFAPDAEDAAFALETFQILVDHLARVAESRPLSCSPELAASEVWAAIHGAVSLEIVGRTLLGVGKGRPAPMTPPRATYDGLVQTLLLGLLRA